MSQQPADPTPARTRQTLAILAAAHICARTGYLGDLPSAELTTAALASRQLAEILDREILRRAAPTPDDTMSTESRR